MSGWRSLTVAVSGCLTCVLLAVRRKAAGGLGWWRSWPRGGAGDGVVGGR